MIRNEKIIKTWNVQKYRVISYNKKTFFSTNSWICMRNSLVVNTETRKNMKKRFRISVRNLIAKHESWYLQINDIINRLKIFEIRKFWNKLIEMKKLFNVLNFYVLMTNANLCEIFEFEIIAIDKKTDSQSIHEKCKRWRKWWNENLFWI